MRNHDADGARPDDIAGAALIALPERPVPTPDEIQFQAGPRCGECAHWRQRPRQQARINEASPEWQALPAAGKRQIRERVRLQNQGAAIAEDRGGDCRRELLTIGQSVEGGVLSVSYYPGPIPAAWPCCGHFRPADKPAPAVLTEA